MMAPRALLSIIVPVFNEVETIAPVIARLRSIRLPVEREVLVVDDGSTDGTREVLDQVQPASDVTILHAARNSGKGSAIRLGLAHARGSIVAIQDADLELDPAQLADLVQPIVDRRADVVYGSRFLRTARSLGAAATESSSIPWHTRAANRGLTALTNQLYGASLTDMETCYKIMRTDIARSLDLRANRFDIEPEITAKLLRGGHRIVELPVEFTPRSRAAGKKIGWRDGLQAIGVLVRFRLAR